MRLANQIYNVYDLSLNRKYNVEINDKALNRIKNSFNENKYKFSKF